MIGRALAAVAVVLALAPGRAAAWPFGKQVRPPAPSPAPAPGDGAGQPNVIDASKLSKVPRQTKFVEAEYPAAALEQKIEADVVLLLDLDEAGKVTAVGVAEPAEPAGLGFDEAATLAALGFEFEPAEVNGKPIAVQVTYRYRFKLPAIEPAPPVEPPPVEPAPPVEPPPAKPAAKQVENFTGKLIERGTRVPLSGVVVTVFRDDGDQPVGFEASTDEAGRFTFYDLAPGAWKVSIEPPGYYPFRTSETIAARERVDATYHIERGSYNPYDVTVTAERPRKEVSRTVITAEEIDKVPGTAGDPLTVVSNFAGVARSANGPGELVIRGSAPEDSRYFIDGTLVPLIFHFGGIKSVVPVGVLESLEFYPGNFAPMYGRATGGIVDIKIKDLRPQKIGGYADVSILDAGVYLQMPIGNEGGIAVAARRSYLDAFLSAVIPDDAGLSLTTAPRYYDFQLLASYRPRPQHDLRLFAFGSDDRFAIVFENPADVDPAFEGNSFSNVTTFYRALATYRYVPSKAFENTLRVSGGWDDVSAGGGQLRFDLGLQTAQLRDAARYRFSDRWALTVGADLLAGSADLFIRFPRPPKEGQPQTDFDITEVITTEEEGDLQWWPAGFVEAELSPIDGLMILPGLRFEYFGDTDDTAVQPRLTARWQIDDQWTAKGGVGLFYQEPTPDEINADFGNPDLGLERAIHYSAGAEYRPLGWLTLDATAYYKDLSDLVSGTDELVMDDGQLRPLIYDNGGVGRVYGVEIGARHAFSHNLTGWLAYTLSRAERTDSGDSDERLFDFDQTHILTLVASYLLPRNWMVGGRFRLITGNPNTPVVGSVYNAGRDVYEPVYGGTNSDRDPVFNQLDVRLDKRWIYRNWILGAYLDIQNIYNRTNSEGPQYNFDFTQQEPTPGAPILTIIGVRGEF